MAFSDHVKVLFGADTEGFQQALGTAEKKTKKFGDNFKKFFVGALGTTAIIRTSQQVIDFGASVGDMSKRLGASTDFLQALQYGAEQSGVKAEGATIAFQRFTRRTAEAKEKAGPLRDTLEKLGISFTDTSGQVKDSETLFKEFGQALTNIEDPAIKVKTAFQFLDTEGVALAQMFTEGGKTLDEFGTEAKRLGLIMSTETIQSLQNADGTLRELGRQFKVFVANYLPSIIDKVREFVPIVQKAFGAVKEWSTSIFTLVASIGAYKASSAILFGVANLIPIFGGATKAVTATTGAVKALNVATKLNPFGALIAGATALTLVIKHLYDKSKEYEQWVKDKQVKALQLVKDKTLEYEQSTKQLMATIAQVRAQVRGLNDEQAVQPSLEEQIAGYAKINAELIQSGVHLQKERDHLERIVENQKRHLKQYEEQGAKQEVILKQKRDLEDFINQLANAELAVVNNLKSQQDAMDNIKAKAKELADAEFARKNNLDGILQDRQKEELALERTLERIKALKEGGEEQLQVIKQKHALHDQIKNLVEKENMTLEQATTLATNLQVAIANEKALHEQILQVQKNKVVEGGNEKNARQGVVDALNKELDAHKQANKEAEQAIAILNLRANGQNDLANKLQQQLNLANQVDQVMQQQNLAGADAVNQVMRKVGLENKIKHEKIGQRIEEIKNNAVQKNAIRDVKDAVDRKDAQRIRASRQIERIDKRIAKLQKDGGQRAQAEIDKLKQVRNRQMEFVLDDKTADDLAQLEKERLDVVDNHQQQMQALQDKLQEIKNEEATQRQNNADRVADANKKIAEEGEKQRNENQKVIDAGKEAIEDVGDAVKKLADRELEITVNAPSVSVTVPEIDPPDMSGLTATVDPAPITTELQTLNSNVEAIANRQLPAIPAPQVTVNVEAPEIPEIQNNITINLENELLQTTQEDILSTLEGYFVNQ